MIIINYKRRKCFSRLKKNDEFQIFTSININKSFLIVRSILIDEIILTKRSKRVIREIYSNSINFDDENIYRYLR